MKFIADINYSGSSIIAYAQKAYIRNGLEETKTIIDMDEDSLVSMELTEGGTNLFADLNTLKKLTVQSLTSEYSALQEIVFTGLETDDSNERIAIIDLTIDLDKCVGFKALYITADIHVSGKKFGFEGLDFTKAELQLFIDLLNETSIEDLGANEKANIIRNLKGMVLTALLNTFNCIGRVFINVSKGKSIDNPIISINAKEVSVEDKIAKEKLIVATENQPANTYFSTILDLVYNLSSAEVMVQDIVVSNTTINMQLILEKMKHDPQFLKLKEENRFANHFKDETDKNLISIVTRLLKQEYPLLKEIKVQINSRFRLEAGYTHVHIDVHTRYNGASVSSWHKALLDDEELQTELESKKKFQKLLDKETIMTDPEEADLEIRKIVSKFIYKKYPEVKAIVFSSTVTQDS